MKNNHIQHLSGLLLATLFISTSGVLGKYIAMPSEVIVWFRSAFAMIFLFFFAKYKKINLKVADTKTHVPLIVSSLFMAAHWVTYFYSLKLSNVALGMLSLFTFPVITALLEPVFLKTKLNPIHIFLGIIVLTGIYILAPEFSLESSDVKGILFGLLSVNISLSLSHTLVFLVRPSLSKFEIARRHDILHAVIELFVTPVGTSALGFHARNTFV